MKRLNLLPEELRPRPKGSFGGPLRRLARRSPAVLWGAVGVGLVGVVAIWQGSATWRYRAGASQLRQELEQLRQASGRLKVQQQTLAIQRADLLAERERLEARREALGKARQPVVPLSTVLADLGAVVPEEVWITKLSFNGEMLRITGASRDTQAVVTLIAAMDGSRRFRDTAFAYTQRSTQAEELGYTFEVSTRPVLDETGGTGPGAAG